MYPMSEAPDPSNMLTKTSLYEEIANQLRHMIFVGDLEDGSRVKEKALCNRFGISRTPLREALKVLASEGLITLLPNRGARISQVLPSDIDELFPVMAALEGLAGELAAKHMTDQELAEIRASHYQMALHHSRGERLEYFTLNQKIHECILRASKNSALLKVYTGLSDRVRRSRYIANISKKRWDEAMEEHEQILAALNNRDGEKLSILLKSHLLNKSKVIKATILDGK